VDLELAEYVLKRLPGDYLLTQKDREWLQLCSLHLKGQLTHASIVDAVRRAYDENKIKYHIDPFELLIDAGICDTRLNPLAE
jgi:DNA-binding SARP family transcriptional activator